MRFLGGLTTRVADIFLAMPPALSSHESPGLLSDYLPPNCYLDRIYRNNANPDRIAYTKMILTGQAEELAELIIIAYILRYDLHDYIYHQDYDPTRHFEIRLAGVENEDDLMPVIDQALAGHILSDLITNYFLPVLPDFVPESLTIDGLITILGSQGSLPRDSIGVIQASRSGINPLWLLEMAAFSLSDDYLANDDAPEDEEPITMVVPPYRLLIFPAEYQGVYDYLGRSLVFLPTISGG